MFTFFSSRTPTLAAIQPIPIQTASAVLPALLPCERMFGKADIAHEIDRHFLLAVAKVTKQPARYIPKESLRALGPKAHLNFRLPRFDLIDPYFDHGEEGPAGTARAGVNSMRQGMSSTINAHKPGSGTLLCVVQREGDAVTSLGDFRFKKTHKSYNAWHSVSGAYLFGAYCTIPGFIPQEYRDKIATTTEMAKSIGGQCRLVVEANWKLAAEGSTPAPADPLIVIVRGDTIAYIDRFDCTAEEEHLAREHAVKVPDAL